MAHLLENEEQYALFDAYDNDINSLDLNHPPARAGYFEAGPIYVSFDELQLMG
jgi:hypothetical protein